MKGKRHASRCHNKKSDFFKWPFSCLAKCSYCDSLTCSKACLYLCACPVNVPLLCADVDDSLRLFSLHVFFLSVLIFLSSLLLFLKKKPSKKIGFLQSHFVVPVVIFKSFRGETLFFISTPANLFLFSSLELRCARCFIHIINKKVLNENFCLYFPPNPQVPRLWK